MVKRMGQKRLGRSARRKFGKRQFKIKNGIITHFFKRTFLTEHTITNSGFQAIPSASGVYNSWNLGQLPNSTDFTSLYDKYKICAIKIKYVFNRNSSDTVTANHELPTLCTVYDDNDTNALSNETEAVEYANYRVNRLDRVVSRYFKPKCLNKDAGGDSVIEAKRRWISREDNTHIHHGMKVGIDVVGTATGTTIGTLKVYTTFYVGCRTPK